MEFDDFWSEDGEWTGPKYWTEVVLDSDGNYVCEVYKRGDWEDSHECLLGPLLPNGCYA